MRSLAKDALSLIICGTGNMRNSESDKEITLSNYPRYDKKYEERLKTFQGIEMPVEPRLFALAGFYYCGPGDCVVCAYCRGKLEDWSEGDDPLHEHIKHYRHCSFLLPLVKKPKISGYSSSSKRMKTFRKWGHKYPSAEELVASGFISMRDDDDLVMCHSCGIALHTWATNDKPWIEHAKWSPNCAHVIRVKGLEFIMDVRSGYVNRAPHFDITSMDNDAEAIPSISEYTTHNQLESFCHNLLNDISCKVCLTNRANVVLLECLHLVLCSTCCESSELKNCPVCRTSINNNAVRVFLP